MWSVHGRSLQTQRVPCTRLAVRTLPGAKQAEVGPEPGGRTPQRKLPELQTQPPTATAQPAGAVTVTHATPSRSPHVWGTLPPGCPGIPEVTLGSACLLVPNIQPCQQVPLHLSPKTPPGSHDTLLNVCSQHQHTGPAQGPALPGPEQPHLRPLFTDCGPRARIWFSGVLSCPCL